MPFQNCSLISVETHSLLSLASKDR
jgi:hypothetical protein